MKKMINVLRSVITIAILTINGEGVIDFFIANLCLLGQFFLANHSTDSTAYRRNS